MRWWRKAADQGDAGAQTNLGLAYSHGKGVTQDHEEAVRWWRKAADQGNAEARTNLGLAYANGEGVPQDHAEAVRWWSRAADQGNALAQFGLGNAYHLGQGVPPDEATAYFWANLAAAVNKSAKEDSFAKLRDSIAANLTRSQLSAIRKRCRRWMVDFEKHKAQQR
jgi:TPR repeat protein